MVQVEVERPKRDHARVLAGLAGAAVVTGGAIVLGQRRIAANQAKILTKMERVEAIKTAIRKTQEADQAEKVLQRAAKSTKQTGNPIGPTQREVERRKLDREIERKSKGERTPRYQTQLPSGKKRKLKGFKPPVSGQVDPGEYGLQRLVNLIELDTLNVSRNGQGQFSGSGDPMTDPAAMQAAYLLPRLNGSQPVMQRPRGRGRPPGSLNKSTLQRQQQEQQAADDEVVTAAAQQQPEFKAAVAEQQQSSLLKKAAVVAGVAAGAGLVLGPRIGKAIGEIKAESKGVGRLAEKLGTQLKPKPVIIPKIDVHGNRTFVQQVDEAGKPVNRSAIFGERTAIKADEKKIPIEEMFRTRVRGIRDSLARGKEKAAAWDRKNPTRMPYENPFRRNKTSAEAWQSARPGEPMPAPPDPRSRAQRKSADQLAAEKAKTGRAVAEGKLSTMQEAERANTMKTANDLRAARDNAKELRGKLGATSDQAKAAQRRADELADALKNKQVEHARSEQLRAADDVLDQIQGKKPMSKDFAGTLDDETRARYAGRMGTADMRSKQGDLFNVVNTANKSRPGGPVPDEAAAEMIERQKRKLLQQDDLHDLAKRHNLNPDALAETMARRQVQGQSAKVVPAVAPVRTTTVASPHGPIAPVDNPSAAVREQRGRVATRNQEALAGDREMAESAKAHEQAAVKARMEQIRAKQKSGVKIKKEDIARDIIAVRKEAQHSWVRQMVSEGKLSSDRVRGLPVGTETPHAREIAFARGVLRRIELARAG